MNDARIESGDTPRLTEEQVKNIIQLATQNKKQWFDMIYVDDDLNNDPVARDFIKRIAKGLFQDAVDAELRENILKPTTKRERINGSY
ncbi:MAG: hypothetical protein ACC707_14700 [Thiohalomonadales bacterium]